MIPKEVEPPKAPACTWGPRTWRKVYPVKRRTTAKASRHPPHRSIAENPTVSEQNSSRLPSPDRFSSECSGPCNHRSHPRGSSSQQERTEHRRQEQIKLEVDGACHGRAAPPWGQRIRRCLWSAQIGRGGALFYPGKLRGETPFPRMPFVSLRGIPANGGERADDRIVGTQARGPFRHTLRINIWG